MVRQTAPAVLAVIDMQVIFASPTSPWRAPRFDEILPPVQTLVAAAGPHVIFTRFIAPPKPQGAWVDYYERWPFALQSPSAPDYQLVDAFAGDGRATIDAPTFAKWSPPMAAAVPAGARLLLAGVSSDCCVLSTALAAADAGVAVSVVADACAGVDDVAHEQALAVMRLYAPLVEVISLAEALDLLK